MGFGSGAIPDNTLKSIWTEIPDYSETAAAFKTVGTLKARIELLDIEIDEIERQSRRGSRKADDIDLAKELSAPKRRELAETKAKLKIAEYELEFIQFRKEIFKSVSFASK